MKDCRAFEIGLNKLVKASTESPLKPLSPRSEKQFKKHFHLKPFTPSKSPTPASCSSIRLKKNLEILQRPNSMQASTVSRATLLKFKSKVPPLQKTTNSIQAKLAEGNLMQSKPEDDSFNERYSPTKRVFFHKIIGKFKLPSKMFKIASKDLDPKDTPVTKSKLFESPYAHPLPNHRPTILVPNIRIGHYVIKCLNKRVLYRKVYSAVAHYNILNLKQYSFRRLKEFFPGRPFGLKNSEKFLKACKDGDGLLVNYMLQSNKWLAHVYDYSGLTALHWAVIRDKLEVVKILIMQGAYVDVNDYVNFI